MKQTIAERLAEIRSNFPCADCRHKTHAPGRCEGCNCGESAVVLPEVDRAFFDNLSDADTFTAAHLAGVELTEHYEEV